MRTFTFTLCLSIGLLSVGAPVHTAESYADHPMARQLIDEMLVEYSVPQRQHRFSREELEAWFASAAKKQVILDAMSRPAEKTKTWAEYRPIFVTPSRIDKGVEFWRQHGAILARAEQEFGVPAAMIVAIIGVETLYGQNKGSFRVIDALSTLAFDYPPRSRFFRKELKAFLLLAKEQQQQPLALKGSYAGAMGYGQFIPSSYRTYAIDYDGDGFADIWNNAEDAIGSVANYFRQHGWKAGAQIAVKSQVRPVYNQAIVNRSLKPAVPVADVAEEGFVPAVPIDEGELLVAPMRFVGQHGEEFWLVLHNFYVITRYNHSRLYAMAVWQLSQAIAHEYHKPLRAE